MLPSIFPGAGIQLVFATPVITDIRQESKVSKKVKIYCNIPSTAIHPRLVYLYASYSFNGGSSWSAEENLTSSLVTTGVQTDFTAVIGTVDYVQGMLVRVRFLDQYTGIYSPYSSNYTSVWTLYDAGTLQTITIDSISPQGPASNGIEMCDTYDITYIVNGTPLAGTYPNPGYTLYAHYLSSDLMTEFLLPYRHNGWEVNGTYITETVFIPQASNGFEDVTSYSTEIE